MIVLYNRTYLQTKTDDRSQQVGRALDDAAGWHEERGPAVELLEGRAPEGNHIHARFELRLTALHNNNSSKYQ